MALSWNLLLHLGNDNSDFSLFSPGLVSLNQDGPVLDEPQGTTLHVQGIGGGYGSVWQVCWAP